MQTRALLVRGLAIIGGIAIAVLLIAFMVRATTGKSLLAGLIFSAPAVSQRSIEIQFDPSEIESGGTSRVSWAGTNLSGGSYSIAVSCPAEVSVKQQNRDQDLCNSVLALNPDQFFLVTAQNKGTAAADVAATILYEDKNSATGSSVGGSATLGVKPAAHAQAPAPSSQTPPRQNPRPSPAPRPAPSPAPTPVLLPPQPGRPDLRVRIIDTGTTTSDARQFFPAPSIKLADTAAILFEVSNAGTAPALNWQFEAWLPLDSSTYLSPAEPPLPAGASARFILGFSGLYSPGGNYTATVRADPANAIQEINELNNSSSVTLSVTN